MVVDFEDQANKLIRKTIVEYVQAYINSGNEGLAIYNDKENPVRIAEEIEDILDESPNLWAYTPELHTYLDEFPNAELDNVEDVFCWTAEEIGGKAKRPIFSINHMVFYQKPGIEDNIIVASKQLYATHYFEAALGLTIMMDDPEKSEPGFYLMHINRVRVDILREIPEFMGKYYFRGTHGLLRKKMAIVKQNMEEAYKTHQFMVIS